MAIVEQRKVIEEVSGWLRVFDDGSVDRTWLGPPEAKFMSDPVPAHEEFIDGVATRDITIDPESGLRVRVYEPELSSNSSKEKVAVILHLHGGGFCISQADWYMYYAVYTRLARMARAVVVSVYLRLAPEHRLPAAIDDGYSALLWLGSDAGREQLTPHADLERIFLIGDSSGGNLVHHVAARAPDSKRIAGLIPIHPGFCRAERSRSEREMPETPFLTLDMADKFLRLALPEGATKDHPVTCPMLEMEMGMGMGISMSAPMLLCVAEKDLVIDTEMEYYEAMKKGGNKVELMVSNGMTHSFYLNRIAVEVDPATNAETHRLFQSIVDFINTN